MLDSRLKVLAEKLVKYSCSLQKGEKILIESSNRVDENFLAEIVKQVYSVGGMPFVKIYSGVVGRAMAMGTTKEREEAKCKYDYPQMEDMDAYISIGVGNSFETSDVPKERLEYISKYYTVPVHFDSRVCRTKWVILLFPSPLYAQQAKMSTEAFEDFYLKVCTLDYEKMDKAMTPLEELMKRTDKVHIIGKNTDLTFSIKDIGAVKCSGKCNIPDGEVYSAPVKNSVNGTIEYNIPVLSSNGVEHNNINLTFKDGKIIKATSDSKEDINQIFDIDEGARYVGEFAIGVNPFVDRPMMNILYDEKIKGSFHFTPGSCYDDCNNGNKSAIHWDLIQIQTEEYGGGEIYFDDVLIRKNGRFVIDELMGLNPENLI